MKTDKKSYMTIPFKNSYRMTAKTSYFWKLQKATFSFFSRYCSILFLKTENTVFWNLKNENENGELRMKIQKKTRF